MSIDFTDPNSFGPWLMLSANLLLVFVTASYIRVTGRVAADARRSANAAEASAGSAEKAAVAAQETAEATRQSNEWAMVQRVPSLKWDYVIVNATVDRAIDPVLSVWLSNHGPRLYVLGCKGSVAAYAEMFYESKELVFNAQGGSAPFFTGQLRHYEEEIGSFSYRGDDTLSLAVESLEVFYSWVPEGPGASIRLEPPHLDHALESP